MDWRIATTQTLLLSAQSIVTTFRFRSISTLRSCLGFYLNKMPISLKVSSGWSSCISESASSSSYLPPIWSTTQPKYPLWRMWFTVTNSTNPTMYSKKCRTGLRRVQICQPLPPINRTWRCSKTSRVFWIWSYTQVTFHSNAEISMW